MHRGHERSVHKSQPWARCRRIRHGQGVLQLIVHQLFFSYRGDWRGRVAKDVCLLPLRGLPAVAHVHELRRTDPLPNSSIVKVELRMNPVGVFARAGCPCWSAVIRPTLYFSQMTTFICRVCEIEVMALSFVLSPGAGANLVLVKNDCFTPEVAPVEAGNKPGLRWRCCRYSTLPKALCDEHRGCLSPFRHASISIHSLSGLNTVRRESANKHFVIRSTVSPSHFSIGANDLNVFIEGWLLENIILDNACQLVIGVVSSVDVDWRRRACFFRELRHTVRLMGWDLASRFCINERLLAGNQSLKFWGLLLAPRATMRYRQSSECLLGVWTSPWSSA